MSPQVLHTHLHTYFVLTLFRDQQTYFNARCFIVIGALYNLVSPYSCSTITRTPCSPIFGTPCSPIFGTQFSLNPFFRAHTFFYSPRKPKQTSDCRGTQSHSRPVLWVFSPILNVISHGLTTVHEATRYDTAYPAKADAALRVFHSLFSNHVNASPFVHPNPSIHAYSPPPPCIACAHTHLSRLTP